MDKIVIENLSLHYSDGTESLRSVSINIPANKISVSVTMATSSIPRPTISGSGMPSGIYVARLTAGETTLFRKMMLLK